MDDLLISLAVIICAVVLIFAVFAANHARKKKNKQALSDYCQSRGYSFNEFKEPLRVEMKIESDWFTLISAMVSMRHSDQEDSGNSSMWGKKTVLKTSGENAKRTSFWLGRVPAASNWNALPDEIKHMVINKLMDESDTYLHPRNVQHLHINEKTNFLLFEQSAGSSKDAIERLIPLLNDWPAQLELAIHSSPAELRIFSSNYFIQNAEMLDKFIRLGEAIQP